MVVLPKRFFLAVVQFPDNFGLLLGDAPQLLQLFHLFSHWLGARLIGLALFVAAGDFFQEVLETVGLVLQSIEVFLESVNFSWEWLFLEVVSGPLPFFYCVLHRLGFAFIFLLGTRKRLCLLATVLGLGQAVLDGVHDLADQFFQGLRDRCDF